MDTTEHDAVDDRHGEAGGAPLAGSVPPGRDGSDDHPAEEKTPHLFREQLLSIAVASAVVGVVVWFSFRFGFANQAGERTVPPLPPGFYIPILSVIVVGVVAPLWDDLRGAMEKVFADSHNDPAPLPNWLLGALVYVLTSAVAVALVVLVSRTNGFNGSPFTPLMTAPAAIGPFMARSKYTIAPLSIAGIASVWLSIYLIDPSSLGLEPRSWVLGLMTSVMLILAGFLSYVRHKREGPAP